MAAARRGDVTPASGSRGEGDGVGPGPGAAHRGAQAQAQRSRLPEEVPSLSGRGPPVGRAAGEGKDGAGASAVLEAADRVNPGATASACADAAHAHSGQARPGSL